MFRKSCKKIAILLILSLKINSLAAVVSDNDGSAFITKAEFDALKSDFNSQIINYENSIDGKIDGAIAQYLSGIRLTTRTEENLEKVSSVFEYPLELYMDNTEINVNNYNSWTYDTCWKPDYNFIWTFQRGSNFGMKRLQYDDNSKKNNKLKWFYKGSVSGENYKITNQLNDYKITLNGSFNLMNTTKTSTGNLSGAVFFDQTSRNDEVAKGTSYDRSSIRDDLVLNFLLGTSISNNIPTLEFVDNWNTTQNLTLSKSTKLFSRVTGTNVWIGSASPTTNWMSGDIKYEQSKVKKIFMYSTDGNDVKAPVTYGSKADIYITNKDNQKQDVTKEVIVTLYSDNASSGITYYMRHMVDPGWCLEPESTTLGKTGRSWTNKSLIKPSRLVYDFTLPISQKTKSNHLMIEGIPLTELPKKTSGVNYDAIHVKFNLTKTKEMKANKATPSIIFFSTPSDIYKLSDVKGDDYLDISEQYDMQDSVKVYPLVDGENNIYISNKKKGLNSYDIIYYKILWNKSTRTNCTISEPVVSIIKSQ